MAIIMRYGVSPRTERILRHYWYHLSMVDRVGHYCGTPLKGHRGVTQEGSISPTIFNITVDAVICHWVALVTG